MPSGNGSRDSQKPSGNGEFARFENLARKLIAVTKKEIDVLDEPRRKRGKRSAAH